MTRGLWLVLLTLAACGRINFDPTGDAATGDGTLANVPPGCMLLLLMDQPWVDSCAGHDGTVSAGAPTIVQDAQRGMVGQFSGADCVNIPDDPGLHATTQLTMSAWLYATDTATSPRGIASKRMNQTTGIEYSLYLNTNHDAFVELDGNNDTLGTTTALGFGTWQQVTVVYDGGLPTSQRVRVYIDGVIDTIGAETSTSLAPYTSALSIGCQQRGGPAEFFLGMLDDVALWSRALSDAEVANWYQQTR